MKAFDFPFYQADFAEYNVAQSAVLPFVDADCNVVVSFPTAVGKTVLAACFFGYHLGEFTDGAAAYVCPYRSIAAEMYERWQTEGQLAKHGICLSTGDTDASYEDIVKARLVALTTESFDSKTRSQSYRDWVKSLQCVVFDEAHVLGMKGRGAAMEASMMRLTDANPEARLILLSATMSNADEIGKWVKSLNNKLTKVICTNWRPTRVEMKFHPVRDIQHKVERVVEMVAEEQKGKTVVFVHSKVTGTEIRQKLRNRRVKCAFHNASVPSNKRRKIEKAFNDRTSGMNVLISTSTLGAGVNIGV